MVRHSYMVVRLLVVLCGLCCSTGFKPPRTLTSVRLTSRVFIVPTEKEREYETRNIIRSIQDDEQSMSSLVPSRSLWGVLSSGFILGALAMGSDDIWIRFEKGLAVATIMGSVFTVLGALIDSGDDENRDDIPDVDLQAQVGVEAVWTRTDSGLNQDL
jgi:hypothetical protein